MKLRYWLVLIASLSYIVFIVAVMVTDADARFIEGLRHED